MKLWTATTLRKAKPSKKSSHRKHNVILVAALLGMSVAARISCADAAPAPSIEIIETPKQTYHLHDPIFYKVKIKWPEISKENRLTAPKINLNNLELKTTQQETGNSAAFEQILTFSFQAQKAGRAAINNFTLEWINGDTNETSFSYDLPSVEVTILPESRAGMAGILIFILVILTSGFIIIYKVYHYKLKKQKETQVLVVTLEDETAAKISSLKETIPDTQAQNCLIQLSKVLERYLQQKTGWAASRESLDSLKTKTQALLTRQEFDQLKHTLETLNYLKFSGNAISSKEVKQLIEDALTFVAHRQIQ